MQPTASLGEVLLGLFGWPEIVAMLAIVLLLFGAKNLPELARRLGQQEGRLGKLILQAIDAFNRTSEFYGDRTQQEERETPMLKRHERLLLFIAEGFGIGRMPVAPGTFGSALGLAWFVGLLALGNLALFSALALLAIGFSVFCCGLAERTLGRTDPPSVVLDEIVAVPVCFLAWICFESFAMGKMPPAAFFFSRDNWPLTLGTFAAFRFFDIVKPWPVRQSQKLPGGWGVTMDDLLAAVYVNLLFGAVLCVTALLR
jgi:phosphatidylglycerophosphatase A